MSASTDMIEAYGGPLAAQGRSVGRGTPASWPCARRSRFTTGTNDSTSTGRYHGLALLTGYVLHEWAQWPNVTDGRTRRSHRGLATPPAR